VNNLLAMSRLQAGAMRLATADVALDEVVGRALVGLGERAAKVEVDVADSLPRVRVDPTLVERSIANVIDNALAWSPPNEPVLVEGAVVGSQLMLRIVDRGPGIPAGERERIFQPFQRVDDGASQGGIGLGLAVARGFAEAVGGELRAEDTPGGGTTMTFVFPVGDA
jgi:two-component system sensor histidine kinase KdpD